MRRIFAGFLSAACLIMTLGGCYEPMDLTDQEMDMIAEYAAGVLVKYGTATDEALMNPYEQASAAALTITPTPKVPKLTATPAPTKGADNSGDAELTKAPQATKAPTATPVADNTEVTMQDLTKLLGKDGFSFRYTGYSITSLYQGEGNLFAAANEGKMLVVLEFEITNEKNTAAKLEMNKGAAKDYSFTLRVGKSTVKPTLTLLKEDLYTSFEAMIDGGKKYKGVLVFECAEKDTEGAMNLTVLKEKDGKDDSVIVKIK